MDNPKTDPKPTNKWMIGFWILVAILAFRSCSSDNDANSDSLLSYNDFENGEFDTAGDDSDAEGSDPDQAALNLAKRHAERSFAAMGAEGVRLYSEWCYEALDSNFQASHRDRCYAFDLLARRILGSKDQDGSLTIFSLSRIQSRWVSAPKTLFGSDEPGSRRTEIETLVDLMDIARTDTTKDSANGTFAENENIALETPEEDVDFDPVVEVVVPAATSDASALVEEPTSEEASKDETNPNSADEVLDEPKLDETLETLSG